MLGRIPKLCPSVLFQTPQAANLRHTQQMMNVVRSQGRGVATLTQKGPKRFKNEGASAAREGALQAHASQFSTRSKGFPKRQDSSVKLQEKDYEGVAKDHNYSYGAFINHVTTEGIRTDQKERRKVMTVCNENSGKKDV